MQVIYFLFALEKFKCLFELISVSFYLCDLCLCEFLQSHLLNENDVNIFETIETRHFNTSNYIRSVVGEVHLLNLINELLLFLSNFFNILHKYSWAKKIKPVQPKLCLSISPELESTCTRIDLYVITSFTYGRICSLL